MTTKAPTRRYACALCGRRSKAEAMVFSQHTRNRFCVDVAACDRRRKRRRS